jgi:epoxyqueuosine reductase QueG
MDFDKVNKAIIEFWQNSPLNIVEELDSLRLYDEPLVGVAQASDPLFDSLKAEDVVGAQHMSPYEWLPDSKSVVSFFLPFSLKVRETNRNNGLPAKEWLYGRIEGEEFNIALRKYLVGWFKDQGFEAMSPAVDERFKVTNRRSNWSERHVAYIAGLGTFSLSCSLITRRGSAGRVGSIIVNAPLDPTPRYYNSIDENCSRCGACIMRCPPLAITESGKDHAVCSGYCDRTKMRYHPRYGCGKCQTGTPCEDRIPTS